jgi:hypothetical protein
MNRFALLLASLTFAAFTASADAQDAGDGTVKFSGGSLGAGIGYSWGGGVLDFKGKTYPFTVDGLSVGDVGVSSIAGAGVVYNLTRLEDFAGNYVAAGTGATLAGGGSVAVFENQNGVIVHFHSTTQGLQLNLSANGIRVAFKQ